MLDVPILKHFRAFQFYSAVVHSKDRDGMTDSVDSYHTAPLGTVRSGSELFSQTYLSCYFEFEW